MHVSSGCLPVAAKRTGRKDSEANPGPTAMAPAPAGRVQETRSITVLWNLDLESRLNKGSCH